jgi:hypothetical protein
VDVSEKEAAMADEVTLTPQEQLTELGRALEYALKHPSLDEAGTLHFKAPTIDLREPISRGGRCPRTVDGWWDLPDVATLAALVTRQARLLGGGGVRRPARRRRA